MKVLNSSVAWWPVQRIDSARLPVRRTMRPLTISGTMGPWWGTTSSRASTLPPAPSGTCSVNGDALNASISGPGQDGEMRFDFNLKRVE